MKSSIFAGPTAKPKTPYRMEKQNADSADIFLYDVIGDGWDGTTAKQFATDLKDLGKVKTLNLFINSPGGSVFDGVAIYNQLARHSARKLVTIDGLAASIASVIAMVGDQITMAKNAMMMIHNAWGIAVGDAPLMRKTANELDKINETLVATYKGRTKMTEPDIRTMMNEETWMTAQEAVAKGFADAVSSEEVAIAAFLKHDLSAFRNLPSALTNVSDAATSFTDLPLASRDMAWDSAAADKRFRQRVSSDGSGDADKMNWPRYRAGHFWYDSGNADAFGGYKLLFVDVVDGQLKAVPRAIFACAGVMMGARGGVDMPAGDRDAVKAHIDKYYEKMAREFNDDSIEAPWEPMMEPSPEQDQSTKEIIISAEEVPAPDPLLTKAASKIAAASARCLRRGITAHS